MLADEMLLQRKKEVLQKHNLETNRLVRESLETALLMLMKEQPFQSISITDIVARAGVSRSGYYRNYNSKESILYSVFSQSVDAILDTLRFPLQEIDAESTYLQLFLTVKEHEVLFEIVQKANLQWMFLSQVSEHLLQRLPENQPSYHYQLYSWIGATVNVLFLWIRRGMIETPSQMAAICSREIRGELSALLLSEP